MTTVRVNGGDGHWIDEEGSVMTTVWSSIGWLNLPGEYPFEGYLTEEELEQIDPNSDDINLDLKISYQDRIIKVNHVDFSFTEHYC